MREGADPERGKCEQLTQCSGPLRYKRGRTSCWPPLRSTGEGRQLSSLKGFLCKERKSLEREEWFRVSILGWFFFFFEGERGE